MHQKNHNFAWLVQVMTLIVLSGAPALAIDLPAPADAPSAQAPTADDKVDAPAPVGDTRSPETETAPIKSLFYSQEEMASIHHALAIYLKNSATQGNTNEAEDFLKQLEGRGKPSAAAVEKKYYTYPQFFLESLVYHSPDDWTIWINHRKITAKTATGEPGSIRVLDIEKDKVSLEWKPKDEDIDKIRDAVSNMHDSRVSINRSAGVIIFTLRSNQTFSTYAMRVLEGKVKNVTVNNAVGSTTSNVQPKPMPEPPENTSPLPPDMPPDNSDAPQRNGLKGLINSYKNLGGNANP